MSHRLRLLFIAIVTQFYLVLGHQIICANYIYSVGITCESCEVNNLCKHCMGLLLV